MKLVLKLAVAALCVAALLPRSSDAAPVQARRSPQNRKLLTSWVGGGSNHGSSATVWAEDTTAQTIDAAANGDTDPAFAARTGVITGEIATYEVQQDIRHNAYSRPYSAGKKRALLQHYYGTGTGNYGSSATVWAEDTTAQDIDAAASGEIDPADAAQTGVVTGQIATYAVQQDIYNHHGGGHHGGRRLVAQA